ncbi:MAG: ThuA domain-containing protein [Planctomycetota bacterium]|jgi:type 1 glutamine amidotransferase
MTGWTMFCGAMCALLLCCADTVAAGDEDLFVVYRGSDGPGAGKHIVLVSGDEEYRSEEALPQLGKILAKRHGFTCTVLFAVDPDTGEIDPENRRNIPGLEALARADLMIIATRFRDLPDEQMAHIDAYLRAGKPLIGLRTATHAFAIQSSETYQHYTWNCAQEGHEGGFGKQILGETWVAHHGGHGRESTGGIIAPGAEAHPIVRGLGEAPVWGPSDVYRVRLPLPGDSMPIVLGAVLGGMSPDDRPVEGPQNEPMMPIGWTKTYAVEEGPRGRVFSSTLGAANDFTAIGSRRMIVNAAYWALGMEDAIPATGTNVDLVGAYEPSNFSFGGHRKGVKPADHALND